MKAVVTDFSRVLIFPKAEGVESLNTLHRELSAESSYRLFDHFTLNLELLRYFKQLARKVPIFIYTDGTLHELPEVSSQLVDIFAKAYTVESSGLSKKSPESFLELAKLIGYGPSDITFIDDKASNVKAAKEAGMSAIHFKSNQEVINLLDRALTSRETI